METVEIVIFGAISEIRGKLKHPDKTRTHIFVKDFLDDSDISDGVLTYWERLKTLEDQGVEILARTN